MAASGGWRGSFSIAVDRPVGDYPMSGWVLFVGAASLAGEVIENPSLDCRRGAGGFEVDDRCHLWVLNRLRVVAEHGEAIREGSEPDHDLVVSALSVPPRHNRRTASFASGPC